MIKKSHRVKLHEDSNAPSPKESYNQFKIAVNFFNEVYENLFRIPEGHYECSLCKSSKPIHLSQNIFSGKHNFFTYSCCIKCDGRGYVDFVTNVMKNDEINKFIHKYIPDRADAFTKFEFVSTMFYLMYNEHDYLGFNIDFKESNKNKNTVDYKKLIEMVHRKIPKNEIIEKLNLKNLAQLKVFYLDALMKNGIVPTIKNSKNKEIKNFVEYFVDYKKERDQRKGFIQKYFNDLRISFLKHTKTKKFKKGACVCTLCNAQPFDIVHDEYFDEIILLCCGKCFGKGYHTKRETSPIYKKYTYHLLEPNYSDNKDMLNSLLYNAGIQKVFFLEKLERLKRNERTLRTKKTISDTG